MSARIFFSLRLYIFSIYNDNTLVRRKFVVFDHELGYAGCYDRFVFYILELVSGYLDPSVHLRS